MSLKQEIETWVQAIARYDNQEFEEALKVFDLISETSKILFNCGVIHATLGEHTKAVECYQRAIKRDNYLAVAYFQQGVSNFLVGDFEEALANFNDTLRYLRGNNSINYEQLGLNFRLYACEVLFNRGLCYIYLKQKETGMEDLHFAAKEKMKPDHDVVDEAIGEEAEGYTVFSIPVGVIYRPNSAKVKNLKAKDYLGKARLIAASDHNVTLTGSGSADAKAHAAAGNRGVDDRPLESVSYGASNLVKTGLRSRSRQQSEPPAYRNMFPPTPPPDHDPVQPPLAPASTSPPTKPASLSNECSAPRPQSPPSKPLRPEPLNLDAMTPNAAKTRIGTVRTASEPRGPSRRPDKSRHPISRPRLFGEAISLPSSNGAEADIDEYPEELYIMHPRNRGAPQKHSPQYYYSTVHSSQHRPSSRPRNGDLSPSRHPSEDPGTTTSSSLDEFEILHNAGGGLSRPPRARSGSRRGALRSRRPFQLKNMRVKVHFGDDTRYIMLTPDVTFATFVDKVREKYNLKAGGFKVKVRDEGDLITMGDVDDWDMAVSAVTEDAREEGVEMGKIEVWVVAI